MFVVFYMSNKCQFNSNSIQYWHVTLTLLLWKSLNINTALFGLILILIKHRSNILLLVKYDAIQMHEVFINYLYILRRIALHMRKVPFVYKDHNNEYL